MSDAHLSRETNTATVMGAAAGQAIALDLENQRLTARLAAADALASAVDVWGAVSSATPANDIGQIDGDVLRALAAYRAAGEPAARP